ncbi:Gfo/Idh/MocA family oxidoreductase [bacterium]|nr:Gfo/Idh/MocA family oxidoreductase [bacterium]
MKPHVLVIGAGSIGERHTRCFLKSDECAVSVCEPDAAKREKIKQSYAVRQVYDDLDRVPLAKFPVVVVATPAPFHIPHSLAAARAGCHVLCEKPLSDQPDGIQELIDTLRAKGRIGATAFTMRSVSAVRRLKQLIDHGKIGVPRLAVANIAQHFPSIRPDYQQIYFAKKALGGGTLFDMCPHTINLFEWLLGAERDVHCLLDRLVLEGIETDDVALLNVRYRDGAFGQINTTMFGRVYRYDVTVHGTEATVVWDYTKTEVALFADGRPNSPPLSVETFPAERDDLYVEQARHFLAATRGEQPVACTLEEGWQTLRAVLAARRSAETGRAEAVA